MKKHKLLRLTSYLLSLLLVISAFSACQQNPPEGSANGEDPTTTESSTEVLKVVNPRPSRAAIDAVGITPRLDTLEGKTIAVIANYNQTMPPIAQELLNAAPGIKVIFISDMEVAQGQSPRPVTLDEPIINMAFKDFKDDPSVADALVFGLGFCGNAAATSTGYAISYEKLGFPTVAVCYSDMLSVQQDASVTRANSMPALRMVTNERTETDPVAEAPKTVEAIVKALTDPLTEEEAYSGVYEFEPEPYLLFEGSYVEAMKVMEGDLFRCVYALSPAEYTDGSPVMLPLEEVVEEMLTGTSHDRDEVIGPIGPNMTEATVHTVAVNGVMAGCKPELMPILLAITEAMVNTDVAEALMGAQGWFSFATVVNGPISEEVRLNAGGPNLAGPAPLTPGVPTNTSIGRFVRLMMVNIGGIEPGVFEAKGIGNPHKTSIVLAEANTESPWPQMSVDLGFEDGENTVSLYVLFGDMLNGFRAKYTGPEDEETIQRILGPIAEASKFLSRSQQGLVVMISPGQAQELSDAGYSREDCRQWISDHCVDTFEKAQQMGLGSGVVGTVFTVQGVPLNPEGQWPAEWKDPGFDPQTIVKYYPNVMGINIVVSPGSYGGLIMNGTPRWTVAIDQWK